MTWAELGDPILTSDSLRDADSETNLLAQLIEAWEEVDTVLPSRYGNTVGNAVDRLEKLPKLREVLDEFPGRDIKTELGKTMGKYKDRVCGGKCIIRSAGAHAKWKVVSV